MHYRPDNKNELLLVFTHIDPSNHLREFILGVHVQEDNTYSSKYFSRPVAVHGVTH